MTRELYIDTMNRFENDTDKRIAKHLNFYYRRDPTDSYISDTSEINKVIDPPQQPCCGICNNKSNRGNFIILSCNHVLHVHCLAEKHFMDVYKFAVIDSEYFATRNCPCCGHKLQTEELMFLHSKFLSSTKDRLESHQTAVVGLEERMNKLKEELKVCYEYKHKLECDREKSKQIVSTLLTMLP
jgi:hypothetical protein